MAEIAHCFVPLNKPQCKTMQSIVTLSHARHFCRCVYVGGGGGIRGEGQGKRNLIGWFIYAHTFQVCKWHYPHFHFEKAVGRCRDWAQKTDIYQLNLVAANYGKNDWGSLGDPPGWAAAMENTKMSHNDWTVNSRKLVRDRRKMHTVRTKADYTRFFWLNKNCKERPRKRITWSSKSAQLKVLGIYCKATGFCRKYEKRKEKWNTKHGFRSTNSRIILCKTSRDPI